VAVVPWWDMEGDRSLGMSDVVQCGVIATVAKTWLRYALHFHGTNTALARLPIMPPCRRSTRPTHFGPLLPVPAQPQSMSERE